MFMSHSIHPVKRRIVPVKLVEIGVVNYVTIPLSSPVTNDSRSSHKHYYTCTIHNSIQNPTSMWGLGHKTGTVGSGRRDLITGICMD